MNGIVLVFYYCIGKKTAHSGVVKKSRTEHFCSIRLGTGVFEELPLLFPLGVYQSLRRILSLPLLDRQSRSFRGLSELDQWDQLLLGPGRVVRGCQHWRLNDS